MDEILIQNTPEKYRPMAAEIVPPLLALLRERRALEEEIHRRYKTQRQEFLAAEAPPTSLPRRNRSFGRSTAAVTWSWPGPSAPPGCSSMGRPVPAPAPPNTAAWIPTPTAGCSSL